MNTKTSKHLTFWLGVVAIGLAVGLSIQFVRAWTEPGAFPPGGNIGAPINTSGLQQTKAGDLVVRNLGAVNVTAMADVLASGNVGIRDASPLSPLTVGNGDRFQVDANGNLIKINNIPYSWPSIQGSAGQALVNNGSGGLSWATVSGGGGGITSTASDNWVPRMNGSNSIENSLIYQTDTGYVGIGAGTTPAVRLHISNDTDNMLRFQRSGGTDPTTFRLGTDNAMVIRNNGADAVTIIGGNVGIGIVNPTQRLDVDGYIKGRSGLCIGNDCRSSWPGSGANMRTFTSSGTFTVPADVTSIVVELWGGGGGGAGGGDGMDYIGGATGGAGGGGGGAGGYVKTRVTVTPGNNYAVTVGASGSGGTGGGGSVRSVSGCKPGGKNGTNGATGTGSSFGSLATVNGGSGGAAGEGGSCSIADGGAGGNGGTANGTLSADGGSGEDGEYYEIESTDGMSYTTGANGGDGGTSVFFSTAAKGGKGANDNHCAGYTGKNSQMKSGGGGGGGGGSKLSGGFFHRCTFDINTGANGGNGANGLVVVYY
jgi:hypothetical protein